MCEVTSIIRKCETATAGLIAMYIIDVDDVVNIPFANDDWTIEDDIIIKPNAYFKTIVFREQAAGLVDELNDAIGGGFRKTLGLKIPRYGARSNKWIYNMIGTRFIALIKDFNDQTILIGDLFNAMRLEKATGATGEKISDENGWVVNMIAETPKPCYLYTGTIITQDNIPPTFVAFYGWQSSPFTTQNIEAFNFQGEQAFNEDQDIVVGYQNAKGGDYLALKYPSTETDKSTWFNTQFNNGTIPDQVFESAYHSNGFTYLFTRVKTWLSGSNKKIKYS